MKPSRGPDRVCTFKETSRLLAGFADGHADEGVGAGAASLRGLEVAHREGWTAPGEETRPTTTPDQAGQQVEGLAPGRHVPADADNASDQIPPDTTGEKGE